MKKALVLIITILVSLGMIFVCTACGGDGGGGGSPVVGFGAIALLNNDK